MSIQFKTGFTMCATVAAGLCLAGCRTVHSDRNANRAKSAPTPAVREIDNDVRPTPPVLDAEPVKATIHTPSPKVKEQAWYLSHGEVSEKSVGRHAAASAAPGSYVVQKGDIAGRIAKQHGVTLSALRAANPGKDLDKIKVGDKLVIPAKSKSVGKTTDATAAKAEPGTYIVQKGDIAGRIAKQHGVKLSALRAANPGKDLDKIKVGDKIAIPGKGAAKADDKSGPKVPDAKVQPAKTEPKGNLPVPPMPDVTPEAGKPVTPALPPVPPAPAPTPEPAQVITIPPTPVAPAATIAPVPQSADAETHTVVAGEDLFTLAIRWGISPEDIKKYNNLGDDPIQPGAILKIPPRN